MRDADIIEAINSEQLATATDRLLLRGGRFARHEFPRVAQARAAVRADGSQVRVLVRRSAGASSRMPPTFAVRTRPRRGRRPLYDETTVSVRTQVNPPLFTIGVAIPIVVGIALAVMALH